MPRGKQIKVSKTTKRVRGRIPTAEEVARLSRAWRERNTVELVLPAPSWMDGLGHYVPVSDPFVVVGYRFDSRVSIPCDLVPRGPLQRRDE